MRDHSDKDIVDEALDSLAQDVPNRPLPSFVRVLGAGESTTVRSRARRNQKVGRLVVGSVLVLGSAQAVAATGAFEQIRSWWVSIRVGAETVTAPIDGSRSFEFTSEDGYRVRVRLDNGVDARRIEVREDRMDSPFRHEEEVDIVQFGMLPEPEISVDPARLRDSAFLHEWRDESAALHRLHIMETAGATSLVRSRTSGSTATTASLVHRFDRVLGPGATVDIHEQAYGQITLSIRDGEGWETKLLIARSSPRPGGVAEDVPQPQTWRSGSGRVRIDLEPTFGPEEPKRTESR